jgi:hypothetical protein
MVIDNTYSDPNSGLGLYTGGALKWSLATVQYPGTGTAKDFVFYNDQQGVASLYIDGNNSNVGIGTITPFQKLHVNGSILANGTINATTDVCIEGGACLSNVAVSSGSLNGTGTAWYIPMWNGTKTLNNSMIYQNGSRIGIGTTNPSELLHITQNVNSSSVMQFENPNSGTNAYAGIRLVSDGGSSFMYRTSTTYTSASPDSTYIQDAGGGDLVFYGASELMRMKNTGNIGIGGVTNPVGKLSLPTGAGGDIAWQNVAATDTYFQIGTTASGYWPYLGYTVKSDPNIANTFNKSTTDVTALALIDIHNGDFNVALKPGYGGGLGDSFDPLAESKFIIKQAGYVGIGTTNPQQKLHVNGSILANGIINATVDLCIQGGVCLSNVSASLANGTTSGTGTPGYIPMWNSTTSFNNSVIYQNGSNVGINTTNPQNTLNVVGSANVTGSIIFGSTNMTTKSNGDVDIW